MNTPALQNKLWTLKAYETGCPNRDLEAAVCINLRIPNLAEIMILLNFKRIHNSRSLFYSLSNFKNGQFQDIT